MAGHHLFRPDHRGPLLKDLDGLGRERAADAYSRIVRRIGEEPVTVLGHGDMGTAYGLMSGKVLKITSDEGELRAMNLLKGARNENIVQVFDVFRVPLLPEGSDASKLAKGADSLGVIVREAVDMTISESPVHRKLATLLLFSRARALDIYRERETQAGPRQAAWGAMLSFMDLLHGEDREDLSRTEKDAVDGITNGLQGLWELGIYTLDIKASNVGLIGLRPVLFDISLASVPEDSPAPALGRIRG